jgi:dihydroorotate dehydrogenase (NAD+) catalytic subunit
MHWRDEKLDLCGATLNGPVINASGTFDVIASHKVFGDEVLERFPFDAYVSKTVTPDTRQGNPPPRLWEMPVGLINSIGLPNRGLEGFIDQDLPLLGKLEVPVAVSVMGFSPDQFARLCERVGAQESVWAIELNVSCPNVETGVFVGADPAETEKVVGLARGSTDKPLIVKLAPNATDPVSVAQAAQAQGADCISLINTLRAMSFDAESTEPVLGAESGGLSGPSIRAVALEQVYRVAEGVCVPVIGMGGIASGRDAFEFLCAGARCVAVGTESFRDPMAGRRIKRELLELIHSRSFKASATHS